MSHKYQERVRNEKENVGVITMTTMSPLLEPSEYLKGYELLKTLACHGLEVITVQGEDVDALWGAFCKSARVRWSCC
jgi:hypothetical protein